MTLFDNAKTVIINNKEVQSITTTNGGILYKKSLPDGTFTDLKALIDNATAGDTITLDRNYVHNSSTDSSITSIAVGKAITIDGNGHIIDGNNTSKAFVNTSNVSYNSITFQNCTGARGGALQIAGSVNISNCVFKNNSAGSYGGGALYAQSSFTTQNITITGSTFINNTSTSKGGAMYIEGSKNILNMSNSTVHSNTASNYANIYIGQATTVYNCNLPDDPSTYYNITNVIN